MSLKVTSKFNIPGIARTWNVYLAIHVGSTRDFYELGQQDDIFTKTILVTRRCSKFRNYDMDLMHKKNILFYLMQCCQEDSAIR